MTHFALGWPISLISLYLLVLCCEHIPEAMASESTPRISCMRRLVGQGVCDQCTGYKGFIIKSNPSKRLIVF